MKKNFSLFPSCIPVRGFKRSVVCNLMHGVFEFIPNILYEILTKHKKKRIEKIIEIYGESNRNQILEYFEFLNKKELGFFSNDTLNIKSIDLDYRNPYLITNAIIDFDKNSDFSISEVISQLNEIYCQHLELRFYSYFTYEQLFSFLESSIDSPIRSINLVLKFGDDMLDVEQLKQIIKFNKRILNITVHSCPFEKKLYEIDGGGMQIIYTNEVLISEQCCGNILPNYFSVNIHSFIESKIANSCLNKKIAVDRLGEIKNCPSMKLSFGNIQKTTLLECIEKEKFKDTWSITKDQVLVCKDCEFRYICHDCRAYTQNDEKYSKPLKCNYNPYEAIWE